MLNKKNIAMVMTATTFATSVAPVFAAVENQNVDEATMVAEVQKMLDTKYFGTETSVYTIEIVKSGGNTIVTDIKTLEAEIASAKVNDATVTVKVTDKGHVIENGRILNTINAKYELYNNVATDGNGLLTEDSLHTQIEAAKSSLTTKVIKEVVYYDVNGDELSSPTAATAIDAVITLVNGKQIKLSVGDKQLDFGKAIDANGNEVTLPSTIDEITATIAKQISGFETLENAVAADITIPSKQLDTLVFNAKEVKTVERELTDFYNEKGYTKEGAHFTNEMRKINAGTNQTAQVIYEGNEYKVQRISAQLPVVSVNEAGKYEMVITLNVAKGDSSVDLATKGETIKVVVTSDSHKGINTFAKGMDATTGTVTEGTDKWTTLAGENRFETAVEISEEAYKNNLDAADTVRAQAGAIVLIGEDAVVDGLAVAPLAAQKNAPILLTKKDSVPTETMDEIKRVVGKGATVYVVGGENTISKDVEKELIKEMNAKIVRLAGEDRYETSIKIAEKVTGATEAFVVGGYGEADAMSIAAVAAKKKAPIIVSPEAGLTQDAKDFLFANKATIANVDVIGGESKVSKQVLKDIKANSTDQSVSRIAGDSRQETNAEVIKAYYVSTTDVLVAQDGYTGGTSKLIDALAAAPLAAAKNAPIVLATDELTEEQVDILSTITNKNNTNKLTKIGGGVTSTVINKLVKLLNL